MRYRFFFSSRRRHTRYIGDWSSDVCSSDLKGRDFNRNDVETVVEVLTEAALADQRLEVAVGRRDDAHVHPDRVLAQIGRASCRERGEVSVGDVSLQGKITTDADSRGLSYRV